MHLRKALITTAALAVAVASMSACGEANPESKHGDTAVKHVSVASSSPSFVDHDGDGVGDADDAFPDDPNETSDENGNGIGDEADAAAVIKHRAKRKARLTAKKIDEAVAPTDREWAQVVKSPDAHKGKYFVVTAQITQFDSATGDDTFLADSASHNTMSYGYFDGENTMFTATKKMFRPFVEDDVVVATVKVTGSFSYDTQIGGNTTVPLLQVLKIHRA